MTFNRSLHTPFFDLTKHRQLDCSVFLDGDEKKAVSELIRVLSPYFSFRKEVRGKHPLGHNMRIDLLMKPKDLAGWKNGNVVFGVECKLPSVRQGWRDVSRHLAQAVDYTYVNWENAGRAIILCWPAFFEDSRYATSREVALADRIAGRLNVGFIRECGYRGMSITLCGHTVWSQKEGVKEGRFRNLEPKAGSR